MEQLLLLGVIGQWVVKPLLGILLASAVVPALRLPSEVATGLVLVGNHPLTAQICSLVHIYPHLPTFTHIYQYVPTFHLVPSAA